MSKHKFNHFKYCVCQGFLKPNYGINILINKFHFNTSLSHSSYRSMILQDIFIHHSKKNKINKNKQIQMLFTNLQKHLLEPDGIEVEQDCILHQLWGYNRRHSRHWVCCFSLQYLTYCWERNHTILSGYTFKP